MAALSKSNISVLHGQPTGTRSGRRRAIAGRADGIFLRGVHGTSRYKNVVNYFMPGTRIPPSDHNLVYTDFQIPGA